MGKPATRIRTLWSDAGYMTLTEAARILYPEKTQHYANLLTKSRAIRNGVYQRQVGAGHFVPRTWVQTRGMPQSMRKPNPIEVTYG